ncbi:MAG TPA: hypothetical protein VGC71_10910 [Gaiellales bacterium]
MRRTLMAALVLFFAWAGIANAQTVTGRLDSTGEQSPIRSATHFRVTRGHDISAILRWRSGSTHLRLYLARRRRDGSWRRVARAIMPRAHPKQLNVRHAREGRYRLRVRAVAGRTRYRLSYEVTKTRPPLAHGPFLTLLFSRSEIGTATGCAPDPAGYANLLTVVAPALARRGIAATGSVETGITKAGSRACVHYGRSLAASWSDLAQLRDRYGWAFVSHGRRWATNLAHMSREQQWNDICGSLIDLERHGFRTGDGLFAFPNNTWDTTVQNSVVATCFAFGRRYGVGPTTRSQAMVSPHWQRTQGVAGGRCNDRSLPCSHLDTITTYRSPVRVAQQMAALGSDDWLTLQSYVLVTGDRAGQWHCTGRNWESHWSNDAERYCWGDYRKILDAIPGTVTVTDPKSVARAWGRTNYRVPAA